MEAGRKRRWLGRSGDSSLGLLLVVRKGCLFQQKCEHAGAYAAVVYLHSGVGCRPVGVQDVVRAVEGNGLAEGLNGIRISLFREGRVALGLEFLCAHLRLRQESARRMSHTRQGRAKAGDAGGCSERILFGVPRCMHVWCVISSAPLLACGGKGSKAAAMPLGWLGATGNANGDAALGVCHARPFPISHTLSHKHQPRKITPGRVARLRLANHCALSCLRGAVRSVRPPREDSPRDCLERFRLQPSSRSIYW